MAESFLPQSRDTRTFGALQTRLLNDLNRPDLGDIVIDYLYDAIRYWSRSPFFFTEIDNTEVGEWSPQTFYPTGSTIHQRVGAYGEFAFVAASTGIQQSGVNPPAWPLDEWLAWPGSWYYEPPSVTDYGVAEDGGVIWVNIGPYQPGYHTQLTTLPNLNQYIPPIDFISPYMVQMTTANMRLILEQIPYKILSGLDVLRPAPIAAYPRQWSFWMGRIYTWVYPMGTFPIQLSYNCAPLLPVTAQDSNFWTTQGERLIRKYAQAAISREVLYDQTAAQMAMSGATEELARLKTQAVNQQGYRIPAAEW